MTKFAIIATLAAGLALAACTNPASKPEAIPLPPAPAPQSAAQINVPADVAGNMLTVPTTAALQSTELGSINGCRIYRIIVDGKPFVLAAAYAAGSTGSTGGYSARACALESLS